MTIRKKQGSKGHVEFRQPAAKLIAEQPEDEEIQQHLHETMMNDGYPSSCGIIGSKKSDSNS